MPTIDTHPSAEDLCAFTLGQLDEDLHASVEAHVAACSECQARAVAAPDDRLVGLLRAAHAAESRQGETSGDTVTLPPASRMPHAATLKDRTECLVPEALARHERYSIVRLLGQGGMGAVFEAEHRLMQRSVALKVINRSLTANPAAVDRFHREVRTASKLSHPNVVLAFDAETASETHFLVMEYVAGATLSRVVKERGPLPVAEACDYVRQAALGLQHAHEMGMVHRDVKPDNLILTPNGCVKVLDFGLASLTAERSTEGLTEANVVMGTPDYLAPEQAKDARTADGRADIYSLGCTLYFLLTGKVPYPGGTSVQKILAHLELPVPRLPDASPELAAVVARMMAKRPEQRYQTPGEVARVLVAFTKPQPRKPRRGSGWLIAVGLLFCAMGGVVHHIMTDTGELVITTESDDVEVIVKRGGKVVRIIDTKSDKSITLRAGVYELETKGSEGLKLDLDRVTLERGGAVLARIERVAKPVPLAQKIPMASSQIELVCRIRLAPAVGNLRYDVQVSKDGVYALATRNTGRGVLLDLYDVATGKRIFEVPGYKAAFIAEGREVVVASRRTLEVYASATGKLIREASLRDEFWGMDTAPGGKHLALSGSTGLTLFDLLAMRPVHTWGDKEESHQRHFSPDGKRLLVRMQKAKPWEWWDVAANCPVKGFSGLNGVSSISWLFDDGSSAAAVVAGKLVRVNLMTGKVVGPLSGSPTPDSINGTYSSDGRCFVVRTKSGSIRQQKVPFDGKDLGVFVCPAEDRELLGQSDLRTVAVSEDARFAAVLTPKTLTVLRLAELPVKDSPSATLPPTRAREMWRNTKAGLACVHIDLTPDGDLLLSQHWMGKVFVWDVSSGKTLYELEGFPAQFTPDGKHVLLASPADKDGNILALHDARTGKSVRRFGKYAKKAEQIVIHNHGRIAWVRFADDWALHDLKTGEAVKAIEREEDTPYGSEAIAAFDRTFRGRIVIEAVLPDRRELMGRELIDGNVFPIYEVATGKLVRTIPLGLGGKPPPYLASASYKLSCPPVYAIALQDGTVIALDLVAGKELARFVTPIKNPAEPAVSADGRFLACCPRQSVGAISVWRLPELAKSKP